MQQFIYLQVTHKKEKTYDTAFKLWVIEYAEKHNNREAGTNFNVGESSVRDWRRQKSKLGSLPSKSQRLPGGGRKPHAEDMEEVLAAWIEQH